MTDSPAEIPSAPALQGALAWLAGAPASDPLDDLVPLRDHLAAATAAALPPSQWHKILDLFQARANAVTNALRPLLLEATLPLARRLRTVALGLIEVHGHLAAGYLRVAQGTEPDRLSGPRRGLAVLCAQLLHHLGMQHEVALLIAAPSPQGLWNHVYAAIRLLASAAPPDVTLPPDTIAADRNLKIVLALAAAQPEGFAAREIAFLMDYLRNFAVAVEIQTVAPPHLDEWFWLEEGRDLPPVAAARRPPPAAPPLFFYSCTALGHRVREHRSRLAAGESPEALGIPPEAAAEDYRNALARAEARWNAPPKRQFHRRRHNYRVQVCTQVAPLWQLLRGDASTSDDEGLPVTDWMVLNESPGGYAIMHVAGDVSGLVSGTVLGLRAGPEPWTICLVRWARSDNPEHVELGLELIAPSAEAVQVVRAGLGPTTPAIALLLPPLPRLDRTEALLTTRGHYAIGPFTLIGEHGGKLQVTGCVTGRLAMQTVCAEVFEFERDFSPL